MPYKDPQKRKEYDREYKAKNRQSAVDNPEYQKTIRGYALKTRYGISLEDYDALVEKQNGACAICGNKEDSLCVDHCHKTNEVRGLLCKSCNVALGHFNDDPNSLQKAIDYLKK